MCVSMPVSIQHVLGNVLLFFLKLPHPLQSRPHFFVQLYIPLTSSSKCTFESRLISFSSNQTPGDYVLIFFSYGLVGVDKDIGVDNDLNNTLTEEKTEDEGEDTLKPGDSKFIAFFYPQVSNKPHIIRAGFKGGRMRGSG